MQDSSGIMEKWTVNLSWDEIMDKALSFSKRWSKAGNDKSDVQSFVRDFLGVFGVEDPIAVGRFEERALRESGKGFIDYLWKGKIAIEMKSRGKDLGKAYEQLKDYVLYLPSEEMPDLLMVSDFESIVLLRRTTEEGVRFKAEDLHKHIKWFADIAGYDTTRAYEYQVEVNVQAAAKMAELHDALKEIGCDGHALEVCLVRLMFCLFADDIGIFDEDSFVAFVKNSKADGSDLSERLEALFGILETPHEDRAEIGAGREFLRQAMLDFPHVSGGLFAERMQTATFDGRIRQILLECAGFDWNVISPAVFGAMFQGVMDTKVRREIGAHYTSDDNILKLINPLLMDGLMDEFEHVKADPQKLESFHDKIKNLTFLDPACGCGNFLIVTYRELRQIEFEVLKLLPDAFRPGMNVLSGNNVSIRQFYGIENDTFSCLIARVGMWIVGHQMDMQAFGMFGAFSPHQPLAESATILNANALRIDWGTVVTKSRLSYILGNPPFVGHQWRTSEQADDMDLVFADEPTCGKQACGKMACGKLPYGKLDYVCCWHYKAAKFIRGSQIQAAFVSTNSIVQGESVGIMWKPLFDMGIEITFARKSFRWSNEARGKATVHCVIVGLAVAGVVKRKFLYDEGAVSEAKFINGYLADAPNVFVQSRSKPIVKGLPPITKGSQPTDGGHLIMSPAERDELLGAYPEAAKFVRPLIGADDFLYGKIRYCLWLKGVAPRDYRAMPPVMERLREVAEMRCGSPTASVKRDARTPMLFTQIRQPDEDYLIIPRVTSENRLYIPIGYLDKEVVATDAAYIIPSASLFVFGMLTSNAHMAWVRAVCGRLELRLRYTPAAYNNFPWCDPTEGQRVAIERAAQGILEARAIYPENTLADLYDPLSMPPELSEAHAANDRTVMAAYGFFGKKAPSEAAWVAKLMGMYKKLTDRGGK
ncbi:MAG: N-6 DNA methylase [Deltaproteobacteria bacterium]|jgi:hypothetical protein|nr:N-6 DNA methylase [Deltaproteobacteria bacterium]